MSAQDYRALHTFPCMKTFTANDSTCVELILHNDCRRITIFAEDDMFIGQQGHSHGDNISEHADVFIYKDGDKFVMNIGKGRNRADSIFVQSSNSSTTVYVMLEEE